MGKGKKKVRLETTMISSFVYTVKNLRTIKNGKPVLAIETNKKPFSCAL
jgi:hypothetical protein